MKNYLVITLYLLLATGISCKSKAQQHSSEDTTEDTYTIYLVRHAEKNTSVDPNDPPLTLCGKERAADLETFLSNKNIKEVYSTDFKRTQSTAAPAAESNSLTVESYDAGDLQSLATKLQSRQQNALVVGHSNTTAVLAGILANKELGAFSENDYDRIYQVQFTNKIGALELLESDFKCRD